MRILTLAGFTFFYLAALNGVFALTTGTCNQGAADGLLGGIISFVLYLIAMTFLLIARPSRLSFITILPPLFLIAWQLKFTFDLARGYLLGGKSACEVLHNAPYEFDGREAYFICLWAITCFIPIAGLVIAFYRTRSE